MRRCFAVAAALLCRGASALKPPAPRVVAPPSKAEALSRIAVLGSVPVVWGTYAPAVKAVYALPSPPPGVVFSAAYYVVALAVLGAAAALTGDAPDGETRKAGAELGLYLFLGNIFQVVGLQTVSADSAAFLVQTTTVLVPALEAYATGAPPPPRTRLACGVAFAGVAVLCADGAGGGGGAPALRTGELCVVAAAVLYSFHVVRLSSLAPTSSPVALALAKAGVEAALALGSVAALLAFGDFGDGRAFFKALPAAEPATVSALGAAVLWCGAATCAYTIWAQSYGQRGVPPSRANLVYTTQPAFSALFAWLLLGESPTPATLAGGGLIAAAVLLELRGAEGDEE